MDSEKRFEIFLLNSQNQNFAILHLFYLGKGQQNDFGNGQMFQTNLQR